VSLGTLERAVPPADRLLLDTSALIAYLDGRELISSTMAHVMDEWVQRGRNDAYVSMVTVMEILVRPLMVGPPHSQNTLNFLTHTPNLRAVPIDIHVAHRAAMFRAYEKASPSDALVIATGSTHQVSRLLTNDKRWKTMRLPGITVCLLSDHVPFP
jgi:predicted nucleic acid-binding protein